MITASFHNRSMGTPLHAWIGNKACLVRPDGKVLFTRDSGSEPDHADTTGWWDLPGGRMNVGEQSFEQALRRELEEEVGYTLAAAARPELFSQQFWRRPDEKYLLVNFFRVEIPEGFEPTLSDEHTQAVWEFVDVQVQKFDPTAHAYRAALTDYLDRYGR